MSREDLCRMALASIDGIGGERFEGLLRAFGSAEAVLHATREELAQSGVTETLIRWIERRRNRPLTFRARVDALRRFGASFRLCDEPEYPASLRRVADRPAMLLTTGAGTLPPKALAIVGRRGASPDGIEAAQTAARIAREAGWCVVSGLAKGIDAAAHRAALELDDGADVPTLAVLGNGLLHLYPPENRRLAETIRARGMLVTEHLWGPVRPWRLVHRNRIISALSLKVLVIEAEGGDGALHTVRFAKDQGREVALWDWEDGWGASPGTAALRRGGLPTMTAATLRAWLESGEMGDDESLDASSEDDLFSGPSLLFETAEAP